VVEIRVEDVTKVFGGDTVAVNHFSLDIKNQEFLTLLGPSGCGKTTLLRMMAGLESPSGGSIFFESKLMNDVSPSRRNVAMVFQSYALYPHMTVEGNLEYPLKKRKVPKAERKERVAEAAAMLRIEGLLKRRPKQLSGGQQQRVALGRAIIRDPDVFLLDEPLSNLDAALRAHMRAELIQLHQRLGRTMIYVTHDQMEAMTMSQRIAVLYQGCLQQVGTPDQVYNSPCNKFVASFLGTPTMNFLTGEIVGKGEALCFRSSSLSIPLIPEQSGALRSLPERRTVIAGIRPEDVLVGTGPVTAKVSVVEPTGYESLVFLNVNGESIVARVGSDIPVRALTQMQIGFRASKLHFFDGESEERLGSRV
jgi:multiple sugar transport system ATP-binding protein